MTSMRQIRTHTTNWASALWNSCFVLSASFDDVSNGHNDSRGSCKWDSGGLHQHDRESKETHGRPTTPVSNTCSTTLAGTTTTTKHHTSEQHEQQQCALATAKEAEDKGTRCLTGGHGDLWRTVDQVPGSCSGKIERERVLVDSATVCRIDRGKADGLSGVGFGLPQRGKAHLITKNEQRSKPTHMRTNMTHDACQTPPPPPRTETRNGMRMAFASQARPSDESVISKGGFPLSIHFAWANMGSSAPTQRHFQVRCS